MHQEFIRAENGDMPPGMQKRAAKVAARNLTLDMARGWLTEAKELHEALNKLDEIEAAIEKPHTRVAVKYTREGLLIAEKNAWLNVLLFASTLTPKHRKEFRVAAYRRFLKDAELLPHLTPAQDVDSTPEVEAQMRPLIRKAFGIKTTTTKKKKKKARPSMPLPMIHSEEV